MNLCLIEYTKTIASGSSWESFDGRQVEDKSAFVQRFIYTRLLSVAFTTATHMACGKKYLAGQIGTEWT